MVILTTTTAMQTKPHNVLSLHAAQELFELFFSVGFTPVDIVAFGADPELSVHINLDDHDRQEVDEFFERIVLTSRAYRHVEDAEVTKLDGNNVRIIHYTFKS